MGTQGIRVAVTGGAGFIGSHLCERLLQQGYQVHCLDNFSSGSQENVQHLLDEPNFLCTEHDVTKPFQLEVDQVYNLACPASPRQYQENPIKTIQTNVLGAINVLEAALQCGARVLQASTSEVYGDPLVHPQPESYWGNVNPLGPRSCYDEGKRVAESLFFAYHQQHHLEIKIVRIFNTYGPRMACSDGRVVSNFITQALMQRPLTLYGDGSQTRSFCYVDDLVEGLLAMMNRTSPSELGPVNLGNPEETTMASLAQTILHLVGSSSGTQNLPLPDDDPKRRRPNIARAEELLNWKPTVGLRSGLEKTIQHFRNCPELQDYLLSKS